MAVGHSCLDHATHVRMSNVHWATMCRCVQTVHPQTTQLCIWNEARERERGRAVERKKKTSKLLRNQNQKQHLPRYPPTICNLHTTARETSIDVFNKQFPIIIYILPCIRIPHVPNIEWNTHNTTEHYAHSHTYPHATPINSIDYAPHSHRVHGTTNIFVINFPGTICSGVFCLCLGIPRFSQHDGVRARIGSFVINTIVGVAQAFTLIFCLVGWGWSIWWGMIMLRASSNYKCNLFNFSHLSVNVFCIRIRFGGNAKHTHTHKRSYSMCSVDGWWLFSSDAIHVLHRALEFNKPFLTLSLSLFSSHTSSSPRPFCRNAIVKTVLKKCHAHERCPSTPNN